MNAEQRLILPFVACGDLSGYDADSCYELDEDYTPLEPVQPPLSAAYLDVCRKARSAGAAKQEDGGATEEAAISRLMEATQLS